jgi:hypothetical protein
MTIDGRRLYQVNVDAAGLYSSIFQLDYRSPGCGRSNSGTTLLSGTAGERK